MFVPAWLIATLPVISALLGVVAGNGSSARHDAVTRLWENRVEMYLGLIDWTVKALNTWTDESDNFSRRPAGFKSLHLPDAQLARMLVFASRTILSIAEKCDEQLKTLENQAESESRIGVFVELEIDFLELRRAIRLELTRLSRGHLRIPLIFRIRSWRRVNR